MATAKEWNHYGDNVKAIVEGDKLTLEIDLSKEFGLTKSEKSVMVASTRGNAQAYGRSGTVAFSVNAYKPAK